jgi:uncharacterized membrane protein YhaH (DUF805 family)
MTSSIPFGRRGVRAPATWPSAAPAAREEFAEGPPRQAWSPPPVAKREKAARSDDGSPSGLVWLLFGFSGRIRRSVYWIATIALQVVLFVCLGVIVAQTGLQGLIAAQKNGLLPLIFLPVAWTAYALQVKRWHDRDRSWPWILMNFVPILGPLWVFVDCGLVDGTPGPNRFGPSPKGISGPSVDLSDFD